MAGRERRDGRPPRRRVPPSRNIPNIRSAPEAEDWWDTLKDDSPQSGSPPQSIADVLDFARTKLAQSDNLSKPSSASPESISRVFATKLQAARGKVLHTKARSELNAAYKGKRVDVPNCKVPWNVEWGLYAPIEFTDPTVLENDRDLPYSPTSLKWADPPDVQRLRKELEERQTYSVGAEEVKMGGNIDFDERGAPLNPEGRTGLRGRGLLGKWGPNHAADPIVSRYSPLTGVLQVLCILRKDTEEWALPGGIVKQGESVSVAVRKSIQECGNFKKNSKRKEEFRVLVDNLFSTGNPVFMGYSDDPRNTDNAWMESKVMHFHCSAELGSLLPLKAEGAKAGAVVWLDADSSIEPRYGRLYGSHMQWVEQALAPLRKEEAAGVEVMGMSEEAQVFKDAGSFAQVAVAQEQCLQLRCVKKTLDEGGEPTSIETFPVWHPSARAVEDFGCSVAVSHLLRFYRQAACLLLVLLLASIFPMMENYSRNATRNECRAALRESFDELTSWSAITGSHMAARCGFVGVDVKQDVVPIPYVLMTGLGTCQEYSNTSGRDLESVFGIAAVKARVARFEDISPNATMCTGDLFGSARLVSYWAETVNVLLVLCFLLMLRRGIVREAQLSDERRLTTGDYSVMVTGLKHLVNPDDAGGQLGLESLLRQDLAALGFRDEDIDHIEVGRECATEAACLRRLAELHVQRQELQAMRSSKTTPEDQDERSASLKSSSAPPHLSFADGAVPELSEAPRPRGRLHGAWRQVKKTLDRSTHVNTKRSFLVGPKRASADDAEAEPGALGKKWRAFRIWWQRQRETRLEESIRNGERQIQQLLLAEHKTTGHAFIVFKQEERRTELVAQFSRPSLFEPYMARLLRREPQKRGSGRLKSAAAEVGNCFVQAAPEPGDVYWENLAVGVRHHRKWEMTNVVLVVLVVLVSLAVLTVVSTSRAIVIMNESVSEGYSMSLNVFLLSMLGAGVSVGTNNLLEWMCIAMSHLEMRHTRTDFERSVFSKLAPAFVINTAIAPLVVGCVEACRSGALNAEGTVRLGNVLASVFGRGAAGALSDQKLVNQWFFESGGIVQHIVFTILASIGTDVSMIVQPLSLLNRYVLAPFAHSQHKVNKLWRPPPMVLGTIYADALRTIAVALIWAPLNPLVLPLAAAMLGVNSWALRFGIAFWFRKPAAMTEAIMERLRVYIGWTVPIGLLLKKLVYGDAQAVTPFSVALMLWVAYLLIDFVGQYSFGAEYNQLGQKVSGKAFDPVKMERYVCPKARRGTSKTAALCTALSARHHHRHNHHHHCGGRGGGGASPAEALSADNPNEGAKFWRATIEAADYDNPGKAVVRAASFVQAVARGRQGRNAVARRRAGHRKAEDGVHRRHREHREVEHSSKRQDEGYRGPSLEPGSEPGARRKRLPKPGEGGRRRSHCVSSAGSSQESPAPPSIAPPSTNPPKRRKRHGERRGQGQGEPHSSRRKRHGEQRGKGSGEGDSEGHGQQRRAVTESSSTESTMVSCEGHNFFRPVRERPGDL